VYKISVISLIHVMVFMAMMFFVLYLHTQPVKAQDEGDKGPELMRIVVNEATNNQDALDLAKKLDPIFFDIAQEDKENVTFYARYLSLDENNENNYIIVTAEDAYGFYCTGHGCPFYIYKRDGRNQWSLILSLQTFDLYRDVNTRGEAADNIISIGNLQGQRHISIWAWNGQNYSEINR